MEIYIEDFIIQNTLINWCLLRLTQITTKSKTDCFKLLLASIIGSGFSVLAASVFTNLVIINALKFVCAVAMLCLAFRQNFKQFVTNFILLFDYTFALCGLVSSLSTNIYTTNMGLLCVNKLNLWGILGLALVSSYIFEMVARHIKLKIKLNNLVYSITLKSSTKAIKINAFLDTGNMLTINGQPVLILDLTSYLKLTNLSYVQFVLKPPQCQNLALETVAGACQLKLFTLDKLSIDMHGTTKVISNPIVAVNNGDKFKATNYQALLSPAFF